ncbi:hypothetical protein [Gloeocapsopsis sp. IPPAS B-1203]|uniref:hypothetical protein n=1 Tax=Gloeocapsopsis sp. IPPAS B-1203 TaxID=2049454 RepID=UPI00117F940D|nr:hypothetical protein [Gloeocapsopsis sp. IPPAS B-1203]
MDAQIHRKAELSEEEIFNQTLNIAHDEDVSVWVRAIAAYLQQNNDNAVTLAQLQQALNIPLVNVWLGLLLSEKQYKWQRGESFYQDAREVWLTTF